MHVAGFGIFFPNSNLGNVVAPLELGASNNRAEIQAAITAVGIALSLHKAIAVHTDSTLVWNWVHNQRRMLRLSGYATIENSDMWLRLDSEIRKSKHPVYFIKVRAHNGNIHNDVADHLAGLGANKLSIWAYGGAGPRVAPRTIGTNANSAIKRRIKAQQAAKQIAKLKTRVQDSFCGSTLAGQDGRTYICMKQVCKTKDGEAQTDTKATKVKPPSAAADSRPPCKQHNTRSRANTPTTL
jgi:ribonuclease HI